MYKPPSVNRHLAARDEGDRLGEETQELRHRFDVGCVDYTAKRSPSSCRAFFQNHPR